MWGGGREKETSPLFPSPFDLPFVVLLLQLSQNNSIGHAFYVGINIFTDLYLRSGMV